MYAPLEAKWAGNYVTTADMIKDPYFDNNTQEVINKSILDTTDATSIISRLTVLENSEGGGGGEGGSSVEEVVFVDMHSTSLNMTIANTNPSAAVKTAISSLYQSLATAGIEKNANGNKVVKVMDSTGTSFILNPTFGGDNAVVYLYWMYGDKLFRMDNSSNPQIAALQIVNVSELFVYNMEDNEATSGVVLTDTTSASNAAASYIITNVLLNQFMRYFNSPYKMFMLEDNVGNHVICEFSIDSNTASNSVISYCVKGDSYILTANGISKSASTDNNIFFCDLTDSNVFSYGVTQVSLTDTTATLHDQFEEIFNYLTTNAVGKALAIKDRLNRIVFATAEYGSTSKLYYSIGKDQYVIDSNNIRITKSTVNPFYPLDFCRSPYRGVINVVGSVSSTTWYSMASYFTNTVINEIGTRQVVNNNGYEGDLVFDCEFSNNTLQALYYTINGKRYKWSIDGIELYSSGGGSGDIEWENE